MNHERKAPYYDHYFLVIQEWEIFKTQAFLTTKAGFTTACPFVVLLLFTPGSPYLWTTYSISVVHVTSLYLKVEVTNIQNI